MKDILLRHRRGTAEVLHAALVAVSLVASFWLRFDFRIDSQNQALLWAALPILLGVKLAVFRGFELRDLAWRYLGFQDLIRLGWANLCASLIGGGIVRLLIGDSFPRSVYILDFLVSMALTTAVRVGIRFLLEYRGRNHQVSRRILIYGAGKAGLRVLSEIRANVDLGYHVVGFIDDDPAKAALRLHGTRVLGRGQDLPELVRHYRVDEVLLALPAASGVEIVRILELCQQARVSTKKIPALSELIENRVFVDQIREVRVEDLLGRPPVELEEGEIRSVLSGTVVVVTGAGGSIGSELCRQIARYRPALLIGFDAAETPLYHIDQEMREQFPQVRFMPEVGSIQNRRRLEELFSLHRPNMIYHAAAYKHVPMMEAHPFEAVENNVLGTENVARAAIHSGVSTFVLVSSDKAVRPTNIMGATKRMAELVCLAAGANSRQTRFLAVRFGNVLGSNGSVIPLFKKQIAAGGPVTVTHPEMRRFFMTIPEAAQLVLQASAMGQGGEVFVLEMGEPVRIVDLARKMVLLSGLRPDEDIRIEFSGIRPGEKLFEELNAYEEDTVPTPHSQIRTFVGKGVDPELMDELLRDLERWIEVRDAGSIVLALKEVIPEYNPSAHLLKRAFGERPAKRLNAAAIA
jgi:FlaA1/EpsC-like NDP-sugar epimerase